MRTWTASTTVDAPPEEVRDVLVGVRLGRGLRGRLLAEATAALLSAGALHQALTRIDRECVTTA